MGGPEMMAPVSMPYTPSVTLTSKRSSPRGAGPALFSPMMLYLLPWHRHSNHWLFSHRGGMLQPRCGHLRYSASTLSPGSATVSLVPSTSDSAAGTLMKKTRALPKPNGWPLVQSGWTVPMSLAVPMVNLPPSPLRTFGHRKLTVPARNSIVRIPVPTQKMRRRKLRRLISPTGRLETSP